MPIDSADDNIKWLPIPLKAKNLILAIPPIKLSRSPEQPITPPPFTFVELQASKSSAVLVAIDYTISTSILPRLDIASVEYSPNLSPSVGFFGC